MLCSKVDNVDMEREENEEERRALTMIDHRYR